MIAKISRGWGPGNLVRYLMGPGRFNEHRDQRVVGSWDGAPELHRPPLRVDGGFDTAPLTDTLSLPAVAAGMDVDAPATAVPPWPGRPWTSARGPVYHCSLRNSPNDRTLSDAEWEEVVTDLMDRVGIAPRGDLGACRWIAVRHAPDHVHVAVVLVRQDNGRTVNPGNDFFRAREVCRDAEQRLGLTETAPADRTAPRASTRAEQEKARRNGHPETVRERLRRSVRVAAVQAQDPEAFFRRLADLGVMCRPRELPPGQLVGYSVAVPGDTTAAGDPIWYGGRSLARDLSLPQLLARWASAQPPQPPIPPALGERAGISRAERAAAIAAAFDAVRTATGAVHLADAATVGSVAHAANDMLTAVCHVTRNSGSPVPWEASEALDRAARTPGVGQPLRWAPVASALRTAAWRLIALRALPARGPDDVGIAQLVLATAALAAELAAWHEQRRSHAQSGASGRSARLLRGCARGGLGSPPQRGRPVGRPTGVVRATPGTGAVVGSGPGKLHGRPDHSGRGRRR